MSELERVEAALKEITEVCKKHGVALWSSYEIDSIVIATRSDCGFVNSLDQYLHISEGVSEDEYSVERIGKL